MIPSISLEGRIIGSEGGNRSFGALMPYRKGPVKIDSETCLYISACVVLAAMTTKAFSKNIFAGLGLLALTSVCCVRLVEKCIDLHVVAEYQNIHKRALQDSLVDARSFCCFIEERLGAFLRKQLPDVSLNKELFNQLISSDYKDQFINRTLDEYKELIESKIKMFCSEISNDEVREYYNECYELLKDVQKLGQTFESKYAYYPDFLTYHSKMFQRNTLLFLGEVNENFEKRFLKSSYGLQCLESPSLTHFYLKLYARECLLRDLESITSCLLTSLDYIRNVGHFVNYNKGHFSLLYFLIKK